MRAGSWGAWAMALRPQSFPIALAPVMAGVSLAFALERDIFLREALFALVASVLMQAITNLQNDIGFTRRGGESRGKRTGLPRATSAGLLSDIAVYRAILALSFLSLLAGVTLFCWRGWVVLAIGGASLLAAVAYMGGPKPIAYTPLGELTVLVFFGWLAVGGTYWLVTGHINIASVIAGTAQGCLAASALALNNYRDRAHDKLIGRDTLVVVFGERAGRTLFRGLLLAPLPATILLGVQTGYLFLWLPLLLTPAFRKVERAFFTCHDGPAYNALLFRVFKLNLLFATFLSAGAVLSGFIPVVL